jgi:radical SAM superfamily enzyme YgiQ (UPF0313 family)
MTVTKRKFYVELIKPSHYDDDGYVIQWRKTFMPSTTLACVYGLAADAAKRRVLGDDIEIVVNAYDETNTIIPIDEIRDRLKVDGGMVGLVGVQTNQFPRARDLAQPFLEAGIPVVAGGFHPSGCLAMLPELPPDLSEAVAAGITLFAGEAENGRFDRLIEDAHGDRLQRIYNFMSDLPDLQGATIPHLPVDVLSRHSPPIGSFDCGRGCPFQCSFCTIINVQGRKSRYRSADDVEAIVRRAFAAGVTGFFITDDDFARNRNWEAIFDRLIALRAEEPRLLLTIQVDTLAYRLPNFVEKAAAAGCKRVFIGLENINPENLLSAQKRQNHIDEYRAMLQMWRSARVITIAGYIIGFPADTPQSILRDIEIIKRELPIDILEFFILTPLPGSQDHKTLYQAGVPMDPDMNKYDVEHVTTAHPKMTQKEWQDAYDRAWHAYYDWPHIETILKRARATGLATMSVAHNILQYYGIYKLEHVHPLQGGLFRRKVRTSRRSGLPIEHPLPFYARRAWEIAWTYSRAWPLLTRVKRLARRIIEAPDADRYTDLAITPVSEGEDERLDLFNRDRIDGGRAAKVA